MATRQKTEQCWAEFDVTLEPSSSLCDVDLVQVPKAQRVETPKLKPLQTLVQTWLEIFLTALCIRQADSCKTLLSLCGLKCESECEMSRGLIGRTQRRAPQNERLGKTYLAVRGRKQERGESVFGLHSLFSLFFRRYLMRNSLCPSVLFSPLILFPSQLISKALCLILRSPFFSASSPSAPPFDSSGAEHAAGCQNETVFCFFFPIYLSSLIVSPFPSSFFL